MIKEATIDILMPKTTSGKVELDGVLSFSLHNAGTSNIVINGAWTIAPGSTFQAGTGEIKAVISDTLRFVFGSGSKNRMEIAVVRMKGEEYSNYVNQKI